MPKGRSAMADTSTTDNERMHARDAGFVLVPVIAIVGLLGLIVVGFSTTVRSHLQITSNAVRNAQAKALTDGGFELAVLDLLSRANRGDGLVGQRTGLTCATRDGARLTIEITDEAGKVDLNAAKPEVIEALVAAVVVPQSRAETVAAAILDYRDADQDRRLNGAENDAYRASGRHAGPADGPFSAVDEIGAVLDLSAGDVRQLTPWLTVASGQEGIDPAAANPILVGLLKAAADASVTTSFGTSTGLASSGSFGLPARLLVASAGRAFGIKVTVVTASGARSSGAGVVELATARRSAGTGGSPIAASPAPTGSALIVRIKSWRHTADLGRRGAPSVGVAVGNCERG